MRRHPPLALIPLLAACASGVEIPDYRAPRPAPSLVAKPEEPEPQPEAVATVDAPPIEEVEEVADVVEVTEASIPAVDEPLVGHVAGSPLTLEELLVEWHRTSNREVFLLVEKLVATRLAFAEAQRLGLRLDPDAVEADVQRQLDRMGEDVRTRGGGLGVDEFIRLELGVEPERYHASIREGTVRQMIAERAVRAWALENENASVRLIVVPEEEQAREIFAELEAGADFAALARERSIDESAEEGGLIPFLVRQPRSPLSRVAFATPVGGVGGPVPAAGHWFLVGVEEIRPRIEGLWTALGPEVERTLGEHPVQESEFLHWKLAMEQRYPVDLSPLLELIGAPKTPGEPSGDR